MDHTDRPTGTNPTVPIKEVDATFILSVKEWLILEKAMTEVTVHQLNFCVPFNGTSNIYITNQEIYSLKARLTELHKYLEGLEQRKKADERALDFTNHMMG